MKRTGLLVPLFEREMELCHVTADETVALVTDVLTPEEYVGAGYAAALRLGAEVFEVQVPEYGRHAVGYEQAEKAGGTLHLPEAVTSALERVDFVVDMTLEGFIHVPARKRLRNAGTRTIRVGAQAPHMLRRVMAWTDEEANRYKEKALDAASRLAEAELMEITSPHGTDLSMRIAHDTLFPSYGYVDEPGKWDTWGQNMVHNYPTEVNGTVVMVPGDFCVVPFQRFYASRVECVIEDGYITKILGDGLDARLMREHMASFEDPDVYAASHFGWAFNEKAKLHNKAIHDRNPDVVGVSADEGRFWSGNVLWSTGPNWYLDRFTPCHYDITIGDCTVSLDGEVVVRDGEVVHV